MERDLIKENSSDKISVRGLMTTPLGDLIEITKEILSGKYPTAEFAYLAGSVIRGEATSYSDLDIVVIFKDLPNAYRESFYFREIPIETFVHSPETLNHFFALDIKERVPALPAMVAEGIVVPSDSDLSQKLKNIAEVILESPPAISVAEIDTLRYRITDVIDDIREPRSKAELTASATGLYPILAEFYLRTNNRWAASRKAIPRHLNRADPAFGKKFTDLFEQLFAGGDPQPVILMAEKLLKPFGGFLFDGYKLEAPREWRKPIG